MSDRTYVRLTVLKEQEEAAIRILSEHEGEPEHIAYEEGDDTTTLEYSEVSGGDIDGLSLLHTHGIAYDSEWEAGYEYGSGTDYCRFNEDGELVVKRIWDKHVNPPIHELMNRVNQPEQLRKFIINYAAKHEVLPWDNQAEYGKLYLTRKLIEPSHG